MEKGVITHNVNGVKGQLIALLESRNIDEAIKLFVCHADEAQETIKEYDPNKHSIISREDKIRKDKTDYKTYKLPQNWQQYINEVAVYFFCGKPLKWELNNEHTEAEALQPTFLKFKRFLQKLYFDSNINEAKRIAGAETECAILFAIYNDEGEDKVKMQILSNGCNDMLYTCFNRYGDMKAFGHKYYLRNFDGEIYERFDIYLSDYIYECEQTDKLNAWKVEKRINPIGKIPIIYIRQPKEWEGAERRIERIEWADSKNADVVEYFADPYLKISKKVANKLADAKEVGKLIEVTSKDDVFDYVTPPEASQMKTLERSMLKETILQSTFTPDLSYENIKGMGAISGEAIGKANILATMKANNRRKIYDPLFSRMANLILTIMKEIVFPNDRANIERLDLRFVYQSPFGNELDDNSEELSRLRDAGLLSLEAGVYANRNIDNKEEEIARLKLEAQEKK